MKTYLVKVQIQFDSFDEKENEVDVMDKLNAMNEVLQREFNDISPQIFCNNIDDDDIDVSDDVEDGIVQLFSCCCDALVKNVMLDRGSVLEEGTECNSCGDENPETYEE